MRSVIEIGERIAQVNRMQNCVPMRWKNDFRPSFVSKEVKISSGRSNALEAGLKLLTSRDTRGFCVLIVSSPVECWNLMYGKALEFIFYLKWNENLVWKQILFEKKFFKECQNQNERINTLQRYQATSHRKDLSTACNSKEQIEYRLLNDITWLNLLWVQFVV